MIQRLRNRIARALLGYRPVRLPDDGEVFIVTRGAGWYAVITASSLELSTAMMSMADRYEGADDCTFRPRGMSGTFSGTIGDHMAAKIPTESDA